ncbi:discoidin domain-containing protein [Aquidulcibacter sp.]|jgi:hypothetical protein|uniref:discoidin domain-containing protein n=1 Tax=Aquidulcibacter sp. TaxID=2052990 RepID=UPI003784C216
MAVLTDQSKGAHDAIASAVKLLTPVTVTNLEKVRVGNPSGDGGYVLLDMFKAMTQAFSYGISDDATFEEDFADRGMTIAMFDHRIDQLPSHHERFVFVRLGLAGSTSDDGMLAPLSHQLKHLPSSESMLLKVDIEGWEWDWLKSESVSALSKFSQMAFELHDLQKLADPAWRENFCSCMEKLLENHVIFHVHANNHRAPVLIEGIKVAPVLEVALVKKSLVEFSSNSEFYPTSQDFPNLGSRDDIVLDFVPFEPIGLSETDLSAGRSQAIKNSRPHLDRFDSFPPIEVSGVNIAAKGTASQSSLSPWSHSDTEAQHAVCGIRTGRPAFHTTLEDQPWWKLEFGQEERVNEVLIFNRIDGEQQRTRYLNVDVTSDGKSWNTIYQHDGSLFGGIDGMPLRVRIDQQIKALRLRLPGRGYFHLDQVEVYQI